MSDSFTISRSIWEDIQDFDITIKRSPYEFEPNDLLKGYVKDFSFEFRNNPVSDLEDLQELVNRYRASEGYSPQQDRTIYNKWRSRVQEWTAICGSPFRRSTPNWQIDMDMLAEALDHYGLTWETQIEAWDCGVGLGGYHSALPKNDWQYAMANNQWTAIDEPYHLISVHPSLPQEAASLVLWHELTHAMQAERDDSGTNWGWKLKIAAEYGMLEPGSPAYYNHPVEAEAFGNMDLHYEIGSLTVPLG